jgi:hydrogenase-4 component E
MNALLDAALVLVPLTTIMTLASSRLIFCIRLVALQGMALALLPLGMHDGSELRVWFLVAGTLAVKGILLPRLLLRTRRQADVPREVEPYVGFGASILVGVLMLAASFWLSSHLPVPEAAASTLALPMSFFGIFAGLFLIVARRKALTQVLGYLVMENGIYTFGVTFVRHQPLLVEMGVLLDLLVGVFVMGIAIFRISQEFAHIDSDQLSVLRDASLGKEAGR